MNSIEIAYPTTGKFRKLYMYWEKGYCERKIPLSHQGSPHVMIIANSWTLLTSWVVLDATIKGASRSYNIKWPSHFISCDFLLSELNCSFRLATLADFTVQQIWILAWCVKRQNIAGLCQQTFHFCSADIFSWSCFASCWISAKIQILQNSCMMKWFHEMELRKMYL